MKHKTLVSLLAVSLLIPVLSGCGSSEATTEPSNTQATTTVETTTSEPDVKEEPTEAPVESTPTPEPTEEPKEPDVIIDGYNITKANKYHSGAEWLIHEEMNDDEFKMVTVIDDYIVDNILSNGDAYKLAKYDESDLDGLRGVLFQLYAPGGYDKYDIMLDIDCYNYFDSREAHSNYITKQYCIINPLPDEGADLIIRIFNKGDIESKGYDSYFDTFTLHITK